MSTDRYKSEINIKQMDNDVEFLISLLYKLYYYN